MIKLANGDIDKNKVEKLLDQIWEKIQNGFSQERREVVAKLFTAPLPDEIANLQNRFAKLLEVLGEKNTGQVYIHTDSVDRAMPSNIYWGGTLAQFNVTAAGS